VRTHSVPIHRDRKPVPRFGVRASGSAYEFLNPPETVLTTHSAWRALRAASMPSCRPPALRTWRIESVRRGPRNGPH